MSAAGQLASLFSGLCDDAAVFPPGDLPLVQAVPAHEAHLEAPWAGIVGTFVLAARGLETLVPILGSSPRGIAVSLTAPVADLGRALDDVAGIPAVRLAGVEVAVPPEMKAEDVVPSIRSAFAGRSDPPVPVFVELPRDERRTPLIAALRGTSMRAKLRTGGVRADLYPDELELAAAVVALVGAGVGFKATAGLHHAVRNTDHETGFEQHGFLNVLLATDAASRGAAVDEVAGLLTERGSARIAQAVRHLDPDVRNTFRSFGTCSINELVDELVDLDLLPESLRTADQESLL